MANKPNMGFKGGYNSRDADSMLSGLYPAIAKTAGMGISNMWNGMDTTSKAATVAGLVPFYGDIAGVANDARLYAENPEMRTPVNFGLSALGLLPFVPGMGTIKGIGKGLEKSALPVEQGVVKAVKQSSKNFLPKDFYPSIDGHNPLHAVMDWAKVRRLMHAARRGEDIPPILVDAYTNGNMLTGTHRAAAKKILTKLGDDVAASRIGTITPDDLDLPDDVREMLNEAIDNSDFGLIDELIDSGTMDMTAQESKGLVPPVQRIAPQDEALRLAQERAALPVEQGGLGLPVDNTPEQRAMAQGVNTDVYHGSKQDITGAFKPGYDDNLAFVTKSPEFANNWIGKGKNQKRFGKEAEQEVNAAEEEYNKMKYEIMDYDSLNKLQGEPFHVEYDRRNDVFNNVFEKTTGTSPSNIHNTMYPLKVQANKTFNPETDMDIMADFFKKNDIPKSSQDLYAGGNYMMYETKPVVDYLKSKGYDSMRLRESTGDNYPTIAVFNPETVRSRFAAFDPWRKSAAIAAAMGVAAPDLMADEKQKPAKKNIVPPVKK